MTVKVGAVSLGFKGTPLPQVFDELAAMGATCVEINGNSEHHHGIRMDTATIPQIRKWAKQSGLEIGSLSGYCDFAMTDESALEAEIARLMATCRAASEMQVPVVRAFAGDIKPDLTLEMVRRPMVAAFRKASAMAGVLGVTLGIENHGRLINDGPALVALVDEVGADNLGFTLDTGNFAWAGHDAVQVRLDFEAVLPRVVSLHVKDGVWTETGFDFVPAGTGELPLEWLIGALLGRGYQGPIYSEYEGGGDVRNGTRQSIAYLKDSVAKASQPR
jgi:sugar phosphate isomerase/epimerase